MSNILVVEDDADIRENMARLLGKRGFNVSSASNTSEAIDLIKINQYDVVVTDMRMEGEKSGLYVLEAARKKNKMTEGIVITAYPDIKNAAEAMEKDAFYYISKSDDNPYDLLCSKVQEVIEKTQNKPDSNQKFLRHIMYGAGSVLDILPESQPEPERLFNPAPSAREALDRDWSKVENDLGKAFEIERLKHEETRK